jgi:hypothetical protein
MIGEILFTMSIAVDQPIDDLRSRISGDSISVEVRGRTVEAGSSEQAEFDGSSRRIRYVSGCTLIEESLLDVVDCLNTPCPDGTVRGTQIDLSPALDGSPGPSLPDRVENGCFDAGGGPGLDVLVLQEFVKSVTPSGAFVQPATGRALVNLPLVAYAEPVANTWSPTLLGTAVTIRATPVSYSWDFGDGSATVVTEDPGAPYPDHSVEHTYTATGDVTVSLTTTYTGEYSVDGGVTWAPIQGTAAATSPPIAVRLVEARAQLTG